MGNIMRKLMVRVFQDEDKKVVQEWLTWDEKEKRWILWQEKGGQRKKISLSENGVQILRQYFQDKTGVFTAKELEFMKPELIVEIRAKQGTLTLREIVFPLETTQEFKIQKKI